MYKYVFIDLDDTLWDFHANARTVLEEIYDQQKLYQHFENFDEYFDIYAKRNLELWEQYGKGEVTKDYLNVERFRHPLLHVGIDNFEQAEQTGVQFLEMLPSKTTLIPYAIELLDYLYPKYPITIVSNGFIDVQLKKIESVQLGKYFKHLVFSEGAKALKPSRQIFEYALNLNGAKAAETIMIGDSYEADIVGARNAGIDQVYFTNKPDYDKIIQPATYCIKGLEELFGLI